MTTTHAERLPLLTRRDRTMLTITVVATAAAGVLHFADMNAVVAFVVAALALATLASLVGRSVEALGDRLGPNATGILQTALGNLPELFVIMFALKAGLLRGGESHHRRLDSLECAASARPGVRGRRP